MGAMSSPRLIDPIDVTLPHLPPELDGVRIAHLTDMHITRLRSRYTAVASRLACMRLDLVFLTGDYMTYRYDHAISVDLLGRLCREVRPRHGIYGVFGNHDTTPLRQVLRELPVHWLDNQAVQLDGLPMEIFGMGAGHGLNPDAMALACMATNRQAEQEAQVDVDNPKGKRGGGGGVRVMLCHWPTYLPVASDMGMDLMFSGHTHGGQIRLPNGYAPRTSTDLPGKLASGVLRHRETLCLVSRGVGETALPVRLWCNPHVPVYTLHRGPMRGTPTDSVTNVQPW